MPLAGYLTTQGKYGVALVIASGTTGAVVGCTLLYGFARKMGAEHLKAYSKRHGRWFAISPDDIDKTQKWFDRYGGWAVFGFRLVPGMRSLISIPAGVSGMPLLPFLLYTTIGSAFWTAFLTAIGVFLGKQFHQAETILGPISTAVITGLLIWYIYKVVTNR